MICQQCGDEGFYNAFVYCVECLNFALHRYCLDEIPKTFDEFVDCVCEDCELKGPMQSSFPKCSSNHTIPEHVEAICSGVVEKNMATTCLEAEAEELRCRDETSGEFFKPHRKRAHELAQLTGECCSTDEDNELRHGCSPSQEPSEPHMELDLINSVQLAKDCSQMKLKVKGKKHYVSGSVATKGEQSPSQKHDDACTKMDLTQHAQLVNSPPMKTNSKKKKATTCSVVKTQEQEHLSNSSGKALEANSSPDLTKNANVVHTCSTLNANSNEKIEDISFSVAQTEEKSCQSPSSQQLFASNTRLDLTEDVLLCDNASSTLLAIGKNRIDLELEKQSRLMHENYEASQLATAPNYTEHDYQKCAEPVSDPIWRGDFYIVNKNVTFDGFVAHVLSKACPKVCEEASLLPSLLYLEMLLKADVWPKSFKISGPSDESIALYFFPADTSYERLFDHLVEDMMEQDLAMKATVKNAELLLCTSTELPLLCWRFQGKFYLWGVFRGKQDHIPHSTNPHIMVSNNCAEDPDSENNTCTATAAERNLKRTKALAAQSPVSPLGFFQNNVSVS